MAALNKEQLAAIKIEVLKDMYEKNAFQVILCLTDDELNKLRERYPYLK